MGRSIRESADRFCADTYVAIYSPDYAFWCCYLQLCSEAFPIAKGPQLSDFFPELLAKLDRVQSERDSSRESPPELSETRSATLSPQPEIYKEHQIRCYHKLVDDGGRPPCSLDTLDKIYQDPANFIELLGPWLESPAPQDPDDMGIFSRPLTRWQHFRRWQRDNRGSSISTAEESWSAFREEKRFYFESNEFWHTMADPDFEDSIRRMWQQDEDSGRWERIREVKNGSFADYVKAARRRLAEHGFHEAFRLLEDPRRQNERVTWIEYLEFEYWWLDTNSKTVQRHKPSRDAAWKELVRSAVLRPGETEEDLFTPLASGPDQRSSLRDEAIERFMQQTIAYRDAKAIESRQHLRVQWALSQMPKELAAPAPAWKAGKRRLEEDEEIPDEAVEQRLAAKKQKTEPERKQEGGALKRQKATVTCQRNARQTAGLLPVAAPAWQRKEGKRRSTL